MPLRSFSPVELTLTERRRMETRLLAMIWLGVIGFSIAEGSIFYALAGTLAVGLNILAVRGTKEIYVHRVIVNVGVIFATLVLVLEWGGGTAVLVALGHYLILLQLLKLFERKTNRDYLQMIILSGLLMVAASLISEQLLYSLVLGVYILVACYVVMVFTLKRGLDAVANARLETDRAPLSPQRLAWDVVRDWPGGALRARTLLVVVGVLAMGAATFLLAPRGTAAPFTPGGGARGGGTGFPTDVRLGETRSVYLSNRVVMRVTIGTPEPIPGGIYLRGRSYDRYKGSSWSRQNRDRDESRPIPSFPPPHQLGDTIVQEVTMDRDLLPTVFAIYPAVHVDAGNLPVRVNPHNRVLIGDASGAGRQIRYTARSWTHPLADWQQAMLRMRAGRGEAPPAATVEASERVEQLARQWCQDLLAVRAATDDPQRQGELNLAIARRIAGRLRDQYDYTLDLSDYDPSREGVEDFLFNVQRGHCEYFASAHVVMCRLLGVEARMSTGFRVDATDAGSYLVRQRDAHAWTEVYSPDGGWTIVDATPAGSLAQAGGWWQRVEDYWQQVRFTWNERFVAYDSGSHRRVIAAIRDAFTAAGELARRIGRSVTESLNNLLIRGVVDRVLLRLVVAIALAALTVEGLYVGRLVLRRRRRRREVLETYGMPLKRLAFFRELLRLLERHGVSCPPSETFREFGVRAAGELGIEPGALARPVELYYRIRWDDHPVEPDRIVDAERHVAELARRLKGTSAAGGV